MNILIVEDEDIQRERLAEIIEKNFMDIKVYKASNYNEAIRYVNDKDINLFFLDINLVGPSGINLSEKIRSIDKYKLTGIIFITAEFMHIAEAVKKAHCYDYIMKPYKKEVIINIVKTFLNGSKFIYSNNSKYTLLDIDSNLAIKIFHKDIIFVKYVNKFCEIYTVNGVYQTKRMALSKLIKSLNDKNIVQTHKAFAVNIQYVDKIEKEYEKLWRISLKECKEEVLLSYTYKELLWEIMK